MHAEIEKWTMVDGVPTFIMRLHGTFNELSTNINNVPALGISMEPDGALVLWLNHKGNLIKRYPVRRDSPFIARSSLRLLSGLISSARLKLILDFDAVYGPRVAIRPQISRKEHTTIFNSESLRVYEAMRARLIEVMTQMGISQEGAQGPHQGG